MSELVDNSKEKVQVARSSVVASFFLTGGKLAVGIMTGSLGILSEAAHSALDLFAALITYFAVRVSDKPADDEHPYGHAKIENFSALIESLLLLLTCVWIIKEAISRLLFQEAHVEVNVWSFTILIISIMVDFSRARALKRVAVKFNSQALEADALHFSSDIFSSLVVILGLVFARFGVGVADPLAALAVAVIVITASVKLAKRTVDALLDRAPAGLGRVIEEEILQMPGVAGVHKIRLRQSGGNIQGDLHVVMGRNVSFIDGHKIATEVEQKLTKYSNDIVVHFEPALGWEESVTLLKESEKIVRTIMSNNETGIREYHDLTISQRHDGISVTMHIVLPKGTSLQDARAKCDCLENQIKQELQDASVHIHIEPCDSACNICSEKCTDSD